MAISLCSLTYPILFLETDRLGIQAGPSSPISTSRALGFFFFFFATAKEDEEAEGEIAGGRAGNEDVRWISSGIVMVVGEEVHEVGEEVVGEGTLAAML